ncbi:MAG: NDP-sugar synthase [Bdellovibrionales bacterium]|nr:NDP-sugar synthase [Bdellovibrionales bacterium]
MNAMILAAGLGERLRPHTINRAKPSLPFLNIPLLGYSHYYLSQAGVTGLIINTHHAPESIRFAAGQLPFEENLKLEFTYEYPNILGSGGGIKKAEKFLRGQGNFLVANGDEVVIAPSGLTNLWQNHLNTGAIATLLVCTHSEVGSRFGGVWVNDHNEVIGFGKLALPGAVKAYHYTGLACLSDRIYDHIPNEIPLNLLYDCLTAAIRSGDPVQIFEEQMLWFETGSEADFLSATKDCLQVLNQDNLFGQCLRKIMKTYHPGMTEYKRGIWLGKNSQISPLASLNGNCLIGDNVIIEDRATVQNFAVIGDRSIIRKNTRLDKAVIGAEVVIPPQHEVSNCLIF